MSPALNPTFYQIKLRVLQGQQLPAMDSQVGFSKFGMGQKAKIDAYMTCTWKKKVYKT